MLRGDLRVHDRLLALVDADEPAVLVDAEVRGLEPGDRLAIPDARQGGVSVRAFAFATAAWLRHVSGRTHDCAPYELRDPIAARLQTLAAGQDAPGIVAGLRETGLPPEPVARDAAFWDEVTEILARMLSQPMADVIAAEAARAS